MARASCVICSYVMSYDVVLPGHTRTYIDIAHSRCTNVLKKDAVLHASTTGTMPDMGTAGGMRPIKIPPPSNAEWVPITLRVNATMPV